MSERTGLKGYLAGLSERTFGIDGYRLGIQQEADYPYKGSDKFRPVIIGGIHGIIQAIGPTFSRPVFTALTESEDQSTKHSIPLQIQLLGGLAIDTALFIAASNFTYNPDSAIWFGQAIVLKFGINTATNLALDVSSKFLQIVQRPPTIAANISF